MEKTDYIRRANRMRFVIKSVASEGDTTEVILVSLNNSEFVIIGYLKYNRRLNTDMTFEAVSSILEDVKYYHNNERI